MLFSVVERGERMADIRTSDYAAEYEFKETSGPRFQETKLRIAGSEPVRRNVNCRRI